MASDPSQTWASTEAAERWRATAAQRQQAVGAVTSLMLDAVRLQPGQRVLDLAAGTGDTSILAARQVGPAGSVLAVDVSAAMLREAALAAEREGLSTIQTLVSDIVELDLAPRTFDAAISRFGLMFLSDVVEGLRRIRRALEPGARLAACVWSAEDKNPYICVPYAIAERLQRKAAEGSPTQRAMSLGAPGAFERVLTEAGFVDVGVQAVPTPREFESLDAAVEFMQGNSVALRELLPSLDATQQQEALAELGQRFTQYVASSGRCVIPGEALLGVATAP